MLGAAFRARLLVFRSLAGVYVGVPRVAAGLDNFFSEELGGRLG